MTSNHEQLLANLGEPNIVPGATKAREMGEAQVMKIKFEQSVHRSLTAQMSPSNVDC